MRPDRSIGPDGIRWCWERSGDNRILDHKVVQAYKHGGGSIMIWSDITPKGDEYIWKK
jgi:hypothetical protein